MSIYDWSTVPIMNSTQPGITFAEGQTPASLNGSNRQVMADLASYRDDVGAEFARYIDMTTEIAIAGTTTLGAAAYGKAYVVQGAAPYVVTLPSAAASRGQLIAFRMDGTATGVFTFIDPLGANINGIPQLLLWRRECIILYSTGSEWMTYTTGRSIKFNGYLYRSSSFAFATGAWVQVPMTAGGGDQQLLNLPFDAVNSCFKAPRRGQYNFDLVMSIAATAGANDTLDIGLELNSSGTPMAPGNYPSSFRRETYFSGAARQMASVSVSGVSLAQGDLVRPIVKLTSAAAASVEYIGGTLAPTLGYSEN